MISEGVLSIPIAEVGLPAKDTSLPLIFSNTFLPNRSRVIRGVCDEGSKEGSR